MGLGCGSSFRARPNACLQGLCVYVSAARVAYLFRARRRVPAVLVLVRACQQSSSSSLPLSSSPSSSSSFIIHHHPSSVFIIRFHRFWHQKRLRSRSKSRLYFLMFFGSIWARFWSPNATQDVPKATQGESKGAQDTPKTPQKPPKTPQRPPKTPQRLPKTPQRPSKAPQRRVGGHFFVICS